MFAGHSIETWVVFHLIIMSLLALDLGVFSRNPHVIKMKEALMWSVFWIFLALCYAGYIWWHDGAASGTQYLTAYVVEKSLSIDNLFVFAVIFAELGIERKYQHRLLFWGIIGAILLRALMIAAGTQLLVQFSWLTLVFGGFLIITGLKFFFQKETKLDPEQNKVLQLARRFLPFSNVRPATTFMVTENGKRKFTLLFAALILIESSDVIFALDSIPAVLAITRDSYLVYTSNIFAILGLRSLFFVLEDLLERFHLLKLALSFVLLFVGFKMIAHDYLHITPWVSLSVIIGILSLSVVLSLIFPRAKS